MTIFRELQLMTGVLYNFRVSVVVRPPHTGKAIPVITEQVIRFPRVFKEEQEDMANEI
jgi:hypothetical protein